jgi:hypothetical protein
MAIILSKNTKKHLNYTNVSLRLITGNLSHGEDIPDILDIPSTVPLYPYRYGTATYACLA